MAYNVNYLLGDKIDDENKSRVRHGQFINFYLSPSDYHRYHIPTNLKVLKVVHIPGKFYPVNMPSLNKRIDLFIENERVVIECETTQKKRFYMVLVSALNVGKMQVSFEPRLQTNATTDTPTLYTFDDLHLNKGDDFGCFEMGSTIVIVGEPNMFDLQIKTGDKVKFSQTIAKLL
jgi:phosphatidylserine decarboxylase